MPTLPPGGRPTVAEIDLKALAFNYRQLRRALPKETNILGVVKADAYGHGMLPVALTLQAMGVDYLGVAISEEGVALRRGGVRTPILVLGGIYGRAEVDEILRFNLVPVVFERESLRLLARAAKGRRKKARIHIKVDTGMMRLGVPMDHWPDFLKEVRGHASLDVEGILSHFSMGDEEGGTFSAEQWNQFQRAVRLARSAGILPRYLHMANSATMATFPAYRGNLVRPGIMLYGCHPSRSLQELIQLRPVMTLRTRLTFLKSVASGTRISYGGTFVTKRESRIATLPIGYADGYRRLLSNRGEVLVRGQRAPVVGTVTMDYIMIDVTDVRGVRQGDDVVLIGRQGKERITAEEMADQTDTLSYEILCSVGKRVPRIYKGFLPGRGVS